MAARTLRDSETAAEPLRRTWRRSAEQGLFVLLVMALAGCDAGDQASAHAAKDAGDTGASLQTSDEPPFAAATAASIEDDAADEIPAAADESSAESSSDRADSPQQQERQQQERAEPLNMQQLFIDAAPVGEPNTAAAWELMSDAVRRAMLERDLLSARRQLQSVRPGGDDAAIRAFEDLVMVHSLWSQAWGHVSAAVRGLRPGDHLLIWSGPALVQDKTDGELMLRVDGVPQTFSLRLSQMDARLAAALVRHRARKTGLALDAHVAALLALDRDGPLDAVRAACVEAMQRGSYVDPLIAELRRREQREKSAEDSAPKQ